MGDRCCCGRITDWTEPVIINDRRHERLGDAFASCAPVWRHDVRDLKAENKRLREALVGLQTAELHPHNSTVIIKGPWKTIMQLHALLEKQSSDNRTEQRPEAQASHEPSPASNSGEAHAQAGERPAPNSSVSKSDTTDPEPGDK